MLWLGYVTVSPMLLFARNIVHRSVEIDKRALVKMRESGHRILECADTDSCCRPIPENEEEIEPEVRLSGCQECEKAG